MDKKLEKIDHTAIRTSQVTLMISLLIAFVLNSYWLVALIAVILVIGMLRKRPAFDFVYTRLLRNLGWLKADIIPDHPEPHRFSQLLATIFISTSTIILFAGIAPLGWALSWIVIFLAALNAFGGFCVGCALYYWLNRLKVPGFNQASLPGTFPGQRPSAVIPDED